MASVDGVYVLVRRAVEMQRNKSRRSHSFHGGFVDGDAVAGENRGINLWAFCCFSDCPVKTSPSLCLPLMAVSHTDAVVVRTRTPLAVTL
jgi:hypothetical protein